MPDQKAELIDLPIPPDVAERHAAWQKTFWGATQRYYYLGVLSVASSSIAVVAGNFSTTAGQVFAGLAAVLTATLGFLKPERTYLKFVKAWRVLDLAMMKYRAGLISRGDLIDAVGSGEAIITRMEEETTTNASPRAEIKPQPDVPLEPVEPAQANTAPSVPSSNVE